MWSSCQIGEPLSESAVANDKFNYVRLTLPRDFRSLKRSSVKLIRGIASGRKPESCCMASMMAATGKHGKHERLLKRLCRTVTVDRGINDHGGVT